MIDESFSDIKVTVCITQSTHWKVPMRERKSCWNIFMSWASTALRVDPAPGLPVLTDLLYLCLLSPSILCGIPSSDLSWNLCKNSYKNTPHYCKLWQPFHSDLLLLVLLLLHFTWYRAQKDFSWTQIFCAYIKKQLYRYILCMEPPSWVERLHTWLETHLDGFSPASDHSDWEPYRSLILSPTNTILYKLFNSYTKPPMPIVDCSSSHNAGRPNGVPLLPQLNIWSQSCKIHLKKKTVTR